MLHSVPMRPIRQRPAWQVKDLLRRAGSSQQEIAAALDLSQSFISHTINRGPGGLAAKKDRVWQEIERVTARLFAEATP